MRTKVLFVLVVAVMVLTAGVILLRPGRGADVLAGPETEVDSTAVASDASATPAERDAPRPPTRASAVGSFPQVDAVQPEAPTNKLQRLADLRETFRALAAGDPGEALRAAKELTDSRERETALLALLEEWKQGELGSPLDRARGIIRYGLEAGLGMELADKPELAALWADVLTEGRGRQALLQTVASGLVRSDPEAAFALSEHLPQDERARFYSSVLMDWSQHDTEAALQWASQLGDPAQQDAALRTIRSVAPVGIGAALTVQNGYPVIQELMPGMPAELSGQLRAGDRILALAPDGNSFVDAKNLTLEEVVKMVRGAPGTVLHLQVQPADASSSARTVTIVRDQIKYKRP